MNLHPYQVLVKHNDCNDQISVVARNTAEAITFALNALFPDFDDTKPSGRLCVSVTPA